MLESIASSVSKEGSDNEEIQGDISYNLENSQTVIDDAIELQIWLTNVWKGNFEI